MKKIHIIFTIVVVMLFAGFALVFDTFPRSTFSELEKRDLASFPAFSWDAFWNGSYTKEIATWFSDSEPYRDSFMALSMQVDDAMRLVTGEDNVTFHAAAPAENTSSQEIFPEDFNGDVGEYENNLTANENAKIANAGIIIVGTGENVRALMAYGGGAEGGVAYAEVANKYKEAFGDKVNVYSMTIPTSTEFYCPEKVRSRVKPQRPTINNIHSHLSANVKAVDVYTPLSRHAEEEIYLRTDHHWAPLGAYYAAEAFAKVAKVPFKNLTHYDRHVVRNFVGSMYGYSKDISVKNAPEDFVYYTPKGVTYTTTYTNYKVNKNYQVTGVGKPFTGPYFYKYKDGSGGAYSTFMGGDMKITQVKTSTKNGRRVMIIKDSFGNAIPGYLFFSFEEVHVVDARYFTKNMKTYVRDCGITDILFAFNIFNAYSSNFPKKALRYLTQADGTLGSPDKISAEKHDTVKHSKPVSELPKKLDKVPADASSDKQKTIEDASSESPTPVVPTEHPASASKQPADSIP